MKRLLLCAALILAAGMSLRWPSEGTAAVLATSLPRADDCVLCMDTPPYCSPQDHDAWDDSYEPDFGSAHSPDQLCLQGTCHTYHPQVGWCDGNNLSAANVEQLRSAIVQSDPARFKAAVEKIGVKATRINWNRAAVQLVACDGITIAHFPVSEKLLSQLSD